jgi:uncharacterized protein YyaL (SSP411 family)
MANRLREETSPYLLQHADNPVDWLPWGEPALVRARETDTPILLSIGYSACHWCHVMAHESFEDTETAGVMNRLFVNVKVDREERPDLDKVYQLVHQLVTGRAGGWPLTVFLAPGTLLPIFAGTYFPKTPRYGMPPFTEVLKRVAAYYREHRGEVETHGAALAEALARLDTPDAAGAAALTRRPLDLARARLADSFDAQNGGFGGAPKFPHAPNIEFLLAHWRASAETPQSDLDALRMAALTLTRMAAGGLYDQLGGGFYRYSVDRHWSIPHFEKMLYDNAALLALYSDAHAATGEAFFGRVAGETADWMLRDMQAPEGGFYSTLDADSEGEEGKFYLWSREEFAQVLDAEENAVARRLFGLDEPANYEGERWHLRIAHELDPDDARAADVLREARRKLMDARSARVPPARDEKILTAWNGLAIRGLAVAARRLARPDLAAAAARAVDFLRAHAFPQERLAACYKDGRARFAAYLDDHVFLIDALIELLQCRWRTADLRLAVELADIVLDRFQSDGGAFFFTADDHESLLYRPKPMADEAMPSGNGVAVSALLKLGALLGEARYLEAAEGALHAAATSLDQHPEGHGTLLLGLAAYLEPHEVVVVRGPGEAVEPWRRFLVAGYKPRRLVFCVPTDAGQLPGLLAHMPAEEKVLAYVCRGTQCEAPIGALEDLVAALGRARMSK